MRKGTPAQAPTVAVSDLPEARHLRRSLRLSLWRPQRLSHRGSLCPTACTISGAPAVEPSLPGSWCTPKGAICAHTMRQRQRNSWALGNRVLGAYDREHTQTHTHTARARHTLRAHDMGSSARLRVNGVCCVPSHACLSRDAQVQLAATSCEDAKTALALEPNNDYAHHLMGRWHYGGR